MNVAVALGQLQWREPLWLWLLSAPLLLLLWQRWRRRRGRAYAQPQLLPWVALGDERGRLRRLLSPMTARWLAWSLLVVAAAGPRVALQLPSEALRNGVDVVVLLDVSRSMAAADVAPDRLRRGIIELQQLLPDMKGDRVGVVVFAGRPHLLAPLTFDRAAVLHYLDSLKPGLVPSAGSRLAPALALAQKTLANGRRRARALLLVSDGEWSDAPGARRKRLQQARRLRADGVRLYVLGVGTAGGAGVPDGHGGWLQFQDAPVRSRLHAAALQVLADAGGGRYSPVTVDDSDWQVLYRNGIGRLATHTFSAQEARRIIWRELYPWLLLPGIVLLFLSLYPVGRWRSTGTAAAVALCILLTGTPPNARAADQAGLLRQAYAAYQRHDYGTARAVYERLPGYAGRVGQAASAYRLGRYQEAVRQYSQAVLAAQSDRERAEALFDLGNSQLQRGAFDQAIDAYRDAARYRDPYPAAAHNLQLARFLRKAVQHRQHASVLGRQGGRGADVGVGASSLTLGAKTPPAASRGAQRTVPLDLSTLIARGERRARVMRQDHSTRGTGLGSATPRQLAAARAAMKRLQDDAAPLWRSLFEREEGFAAPVTSPQTIKGVAPW
ncbi:MAG: VWA domain-containing protein [Gammaproteobacteria bacterium]